MKFFRNISINKRIQLVLIPLVVLLFAFSGIILNKLSTKRVLTSAQNEMEVYIDGLASMMQLAEGTTEKGYSSADYLLIKPFFSKKAFYKTDYPFLFNSSGQYIIHLFKEGDRLPSAAIRQVLANRNKSGFTEFDDFEGTSKIEMILYYKYFETYNTYIGISARKDELFESLYQNRFVLMIIVFFAVIVFSVVINIVLNPITQIITKINTSIKTLSTGETPEKFHSDYKDEVGQIVESLNSLVVGLKQTADFANEIGENHLDTEYKTLGDNDVLGNSLINMRSSLKTALEEETKRKQEDEIRSWTTTGLAKFGDILRQDNNNLEHLADNINQNLVNYLDANQGGLFIYNDDDPENKHLELVSSFAYNRKKFLEKNIHLNEGLVGTCAVEKQTIYLKEVPDDYIKITSGLGDAPPSTLLIVPLKLEEAIFGVLEIASFKEFRKFEIEFVERIGESIASTLSAVKNGIRTKQLLEQSQQQREEMAAQEEEMRQNMEEMQATQEEMARKTLEMEGMSAAINEALLYCELDGSGSINNPNINLLTLTGYSRSELDGKNLTELIHNNESSYFKDQWSEIISGQSFKSTMHWVDRNNNELYVLASISPAYDEMGSIYKIYFLGQDVTENKQLELRAQKQAEEIEQNLLEIRVEQELSAQREEEMKALLQALNSICLITELDPSGLITFINQRNVELLGDKKEDIEGKFLAEIDFKAKANPKEFEKFWNKLISGVKQKRDFNLTVKGKEIYITENFIPVKNESGTLVKIINIGFDITESKLKEKEMDRLIAELESLKNKKNK